MKSHAKKSSFTLPAPELFLVKKLKKKLDIKSNTALIRRALQELEQRVDRQTLRRQFEMASALICQENRQEMSELDELAGEGL